MSEGDKALIEATGERFVPSSSEVESELEHLHRYLLAAPLCVGKRVLDAACGEGYGAVLLAKAGAHVTGVDIDVATIEAARLRYPGLELLEADIASLPFPDATFDFVTSFETVEHVPHFEAILDEFRRVLKPDGVLIVSTPDRSIYNQYLASPNSFHVKELERDEFEAELRDRFTDVRMYGQRVVFGSLISSPSGGDLNVLRRVDGLGVSESPAYDRAMYLVAVCSNGPPPPLAEGIYEGAIPQNAMSSILGGVAERDQEILKLRSLLAAGDSAAGPEAAAALLQEVEAARRKLRTAEKEAAEKLRLARREAAEAQALYRALSADHQQLLAIATMATEDLNRLSAEREEARAAGRIRKFGDRLNAADEAARMAELRLFAAEDRIAALAAERDAFAGKLALALQTNQGTVRKKRSPEMERLLTLLGDAVAAFRSLPSGAKVAMRTWVSLRAIRRSNLFVPDFYKQGRSDLEAIDPVRHYLKFGVAEGRDPSPMFSVSGYLRRYPDVARVGYDPLAHYIRHGRGHGWFATPSRSALIADDASGGRSRSGCGPGGMGSNLSSMGLQTHGWRAAETPEIEESDLALYDVRPDDDVPREAARGERFLEAHRLLTSEPDYAAAIDALNAKAASGGPTPDPDVSIVIPVYGQLGYTLNCLDALLSHVSRYAREVIVVDDASTDETAARLPEVRGVTYIRHVANSGFIASSNDGAKAARGRILVMLNNDTRVVQGWLDEMVETLDARPQAGLVGSKLFYPDGSLQEAGGIIWQDGSAWNYGRNEDPNRPEFSYARQVDYISGAAIALPANLWRELGGFDPHYSPAYCEDSDLAFRVRAMGRQTWLQPLSRVIHYEGKTNGVDVARGVKAYQVENSRKLQARWRGVLGDHRPNGVEPWLEKDRGVRRRVLIIDATAPTPDQDAGSVTTIKVISVFQELGFKVVFAPVHNFLYQRRYIGDLQRRGVECLYVPYVTLLEEHLRRYGEAYDVIHIFRHEVMATTIDGIKTFCPNATVMFNNMDLHYLRMQRQAETEGRRDKLAEIEAVKAGEIATMRRADIVFVPSTFERDVLLREDLGRPVEVMPFMVDEEDPVDAHSAATDLVFLGGFGHTPNIDAVTWFHDEIWPRIATTRPDVRFVIVGANPPPAIERLRSKRVVVTGRVDDLRPVFVCARAFVAPLRYGAGVKGKLYTAMSFGAPIVATSIGVEGIGLVPEEHALVADDAASFSAAVLRVLDDPALASRLRKAGPAFIAQNATLAAGVRVMRRVLEK